TIAKDVKIQVEFNPNRVQAYRLIGYENRLLRDEDFNDDTKDAGELGAGHSVTALYEVVPVGVEGTVDVQGVDLLRYRTPGTVRPSADSAELLFVKLRYKEPDGDSSRLIQQPVTDSEPAASTDLRFAAAVAGFGMLLRQSEYCGDLSLGDVLKMARDAQGDDEEGYRSEFIKLVDAVNTTELLAQATY
ncbi:MAG: DUF3520 domain-containing protein, partial [Gemmatimonadota bacterium]